MTDYPCGCAFDGVDPVHVCAEHLAEWEPIISWRRGVKAGDAVRFKVGPLADDLWTGVLTEVGAVCLVAVEPGAGVVEVRRRQLLPPAKTK